MIKMLNMQFLKIASIVFALHSDANVEWENDTAEMGVGGSITDCIINKLPHSWPVRTIIYILIICQY